jgi:hypothetical protein
MEVPLIALCGHMDGITKSAGTFRQNVSLKLRTIIKTAMISTTTKN